MNININKKLKFIATFKLKVELSESFVYIVLKIDTKNRINCKMRVINSENLHKNRKQDDFETEKPSI